MENWKFIEGFEGFYMISDAGNVKSVDRLVNGRWHKEQKVKGQKIQPSKDKDGYLRVALRKNGIRRYFRINILVASAFIPNVYNKPVVNHINEIKSDNRVKNLEWCSFKENTNHGTCVSRGAKKRLKKVLMQDLNGNVIKEYDGIVLTKKDGFNVSKVSDCARGERKTHKGFKWEFKNVNL